MLLSVDDFGCVFDGRYHSHVSIQAGSAQLSAPGGALRQADVGKHIAIPGAVDLVATVSGLLARKDVASASMEAGGCTLTAVLTGADGCRRLLPGPRSRGVAHHGRRGPPAGCVAGQRRFQGDRAGRRSNSPTRR